MSLPHVLAELRDDCFKTFLDERQSLSILTMLLINATAASDFHELAELPAGLPFPVDAQALSRERKKVEHDYLTAHRLQAIRSVQARMDNALLRLCKLLCKERGIRLGLHDVYGNDVVGGAKRLLVEQFRLEINPLLWERAGACARLAALAGSLSRGEAMPASPHPVPDEIGGVIVRMPDGIRVDPNAPERMLMAAECLFSAIFTALESGFDQTPSPSTSC